MKTIPLQQPTDLLRRNVTFSKKVVFGTAKTLSQLVLGNTGIATNEFLNILDAMGLSQNPSELAWELVFKSLFTGIKNLLAENTLLTLDTTNNPASHINQDINSDDINNYNINNHDINSNAASNHLISTEQTHQLSTLAFQITEYLQTNNVDNSNSSTQTNPNSLHSIDQDFFSKPNQAPVITGFANILKHWLASLGVHSTDINNFANRYGDYVALAFCDIWRSDAAKYQKLLDTSTPADKRAQEIMNWRLYRQKLQHVVQTPVFNETISLQQLFIELRASYIDVEQLAEENEMDGTNIRIHERNTPHKLVMLNEHIEHWYQQDDKKDAIRLLCGGPGSGKSSSAKIIAANFAKKGERVVFLPLHHLRFNDAFDKVIDDYLASVDRLGMPLFNDNDFAKTLVIFDGLDELAMQGKSAENDAKAFVNWLKNKVASLNEFKLRIKVLITGRDVIIQQQQQQFRKPRQILHLLPYVIGNENKRKYKNASHIHLDQRRQWWQTFSKLKGWHKTDIPNVYTQGKLGEITAQPLLNYLVALYHISNQQILDSNTNLNDIYRELIDNVYRRSWGEGVNPHLERSQLSQAEFAQVLQLVAVSAWHGSGRTATEDEIEQTFKRFNKTKLLNKFELYKQDASDNKLTQLLTAFYFKKIGADNIGNHTFEFTHKSFEEYLVAQQLRSFLCKLPNWMENDDIDANTTLLKWVDLTGQTALNTYYFDFFIDEIKLLQQQKPDTLKQIHSAIVELFSHMLKHDLPMHQCTHLASYQQRKQHARNAKDALLACMGCVSNITQQLAHITFYTPTDFGNLLNEIRLQRQGANNPIAYAHLTYLILDKQVFDIADMYKVNLSNSCLQHVSMCIVNLREANLRLTDLRGANLREADLREANLSETDLRGAYLREADLREADLREAYLRKADLRKADLREAYLRQAHLTGVDLLQANLTGANLTGADLTGADLTGADLIQADLRQAHLRGASLRGASLRGASLTGADLIQADLTEADLEEADLRQAHLRGASLTGADLIQADLTEADLEEADLRMAKLNGAKNLDLTGAIVD